MKYFLLYIKQTLRFVLKPMSFLPAIAMMGLIFYFSSQNGATSASLSYKVSLKAVTIADEVLDENWTDAEVRQKTTRLHYYVRKTAHVTEYFLLAAFVALPLYVYRVRGVWLTFTAGIFCVAFACLDEYHQTFVSGRAGQPKDVGIDSIGIFLGILTAHIICYIGRKTVFRPLSYNEDEKRRQRRRRLKNRG